MILLPDFPVQIRGTHPLAYATFSVNGDNVEPQCWTEYFCVKPSISVQKGETFQMPSGRVSSQLGRTGVWGFSTKLIVHDDALSPHLNYLISLLNLPRSDLTERPWKLSAKMVFLCYWSNYSGDRVPVIDREISNLIEASQGIIEIDEYPQRHKSVDSTGKENDLWI